MKQKPRMAAILACLLFPLGGIVGWFLQQKFGLLSLSDQSPITSYMEGSGRIDLFHLPDSGKYIVSYIDTSGLTRVSLEIEGQNSKIVVRSRASKKEITVVDEDADGFPEYCLFEGEIDELKTVKIELIDHVKN